MLSRGGGRARRRRTAVAVQDALFEVQVQPERRYYRQMLDVLARERIGTDPLLAERLVSGLFGTVWAEATRDGLFEETFGLGLVSYARRHRVPSSVAVLRTVARIAPVREIREAALQAAVDLVAEGLPEPAWMPPLDGLVAGSCWALEDVFGDATMILCEFSYGAERHAIMVQVEHNDFSAATGAVLTEDVDAMLRDFRRVSRGPHALFTTRRVDPGWARALLERAIARTDLITGLHTEPTYAPVRALVLARLSALPDDPGSLPAEQPPPSQPQIDAIVADFLGSESGRPLADEPAAAALARRIVEHAGVRDPDRLLRVSAEKWESFVDDWLPDQDLSPDERARAADVIQAWNAWASRPLPATARSALAVALREILEPLSKLR